MAPFPFSPHHLLLLLLICTTTAITTHAVNTNPDIFLTVCATGTGTKTAPSTDQTIPSFYVNVTNSGLGTAVTGTTNSSVYGLAQCFNYLDGQLCFGCSNTLNIYKQCMAVGGCVYLDSSFFHVSDYNFFQDAVDSKDASQCSNSSVSTWNSILFNNCVGELMNDLATGAGSSDGQWRSQESNQGG